MRQIKKKIWSGYLVLATARIHLAPMYVTDFVPSSHSQLLATT